MEQSAFVLGVVRFAPRGGTAGAARFDAKSLSCLASWNCEFQVAGRVVCATTLIILKIDGVAPSQESCPPGGFQ
jgi:hypothetical protein